MAEFILHAGLHKTATTSLQEHVFPQVQGGFYTGKCRHVMANRSRKLLAEFCAYLETELEAIHRLPLHTCAFYLSLLQDQLVGDLARSRRSLDQCSAELQLNQRLVDSLVLRSECSTILYSCEGLLLSLGHLYPERCKSLADLFPLAHWRALFPAPVQRAVIYLRTPIDYLYSRYIQIHTVRCRGGGSQAGDIISPSRYIKLNEKLWRGPMPSQSVFHHILQPQLVTQLQQLGLNLIVRSYDQHIKKAASISAEVGEAFGLRLHQPEWVDERFRTIRLNTTAADKEVAMQALLKSLGLSSAGQLQAEFSETARESPVVREALATSLYPD